MRPGKVRALWRRRTAARLSFSLNADAGPIGFDAARCRAATPDALLRLSVSETSAEPRANRKVSQKKRSQYQVLPPNALADDQQLFVTAQPL